MCTYRSFFLSDPFVQSQMLYMRERVYASVFFFHEDDSHSFTNTPFWVCTAHLLLLNQVKYRLANIEDLQTYEISSHLIHKENICLTSLETSSFFNLKYAQGDLLLSFLVLVLLLAALGLIPFA